MSNVSEKIMNRIKKLMILGLGDPESPEATSAITKATELMQLHGIDKVDLEADGHVKAESLIEEFVEVFNHNSGIWEGPLGLKIATSFDCKMITVRRERGILPQRAFLGAKGDVALSIYFFKFIRMQIQRRSEEYKLVKDQKTYGYGCTLKVIDRLEEMYKKRKEVMTPDTQALIVIKGNDVAKFYKEQYPHTRKASRGKLTGNHDAFLAGQSDGSKIQMNRQVDSKSATGAIMIGG